MCLDVLASHEFERLVQKSNSHMSGSLSGSETATDVRNRGALHQVQLWRLLQGLFSTGSFLLRHGQFLLMVRTLFRISVLSGRYTCEKW